MEVKHYNCWGGRCWWMVKFRLEVLWKHYSNEGQHCLIKFVHPLLNVQCWSQVLNALLIIILLHNMPLYWTFGCYSVLQYQEQEKSCAHDAHGRCCKGGKPNKGSQLLRIVGTNFVAKWISRKSQSCFRSKLLSSSKSRLWGTSVLSWPSPSSPQYHHVTITVAITNKSIIR